MKKSIRILWILLLPFILSSCLVERQLANEFISEWTPPALLVMAPDVVLKENLEAEKINKRKDLTRQEKDSLIFFSSKYLDLVSDSVFLETYVNAFIAELRKQGYLVFVERDLDTFLTYQGREAYILDMAQVMLEEYVIHHTEEEVFDDTIVYYKKFNLDAVNINSWFELSKMNSQDELPRLLYASHYLQDYLKGRFTRHPLKGDVSFKYQKRPISVEDIYKLSGILGRKYASWVTDFFINEYIRGELPEGLEPEVRYSYDHENGKLRRSYDDRFLELEN